MYAFEFADVAYAAKKNLGAEVIGLIENERSAGEYPHGVIAWRDEKRRFARGQCGTHRFFARTGNTGSQVEVIFHQGSDDLTRERALADLIDRAEVQTLAELQQ